MKFSYQIAAPEIKRQFNITSLTGELESSFDRLKKRGYDGAEIMVCRPLAKDADIIAALTKKYSLDVPMICTGEIAGQGGCCLSSSIRSIRNEAIRRAKTSIDIAERLGAQINVGRLRGSLDLDKVRAKDSRRWAVEGLAAISEHAGGKGVVVALEPGHSVYCNFINTTQEGIDLVKEINNPAFRLMLDIYHIYLEDVDMWRSISEAKEYLTYVHLSDTNRRYPGGCKMDFERVFSAFKSTGYDGFYGVEILQVPDEEVALEKSIDFLRKFR